MAEDLQIDESILKDLSQIKKLSELEILASGMTTHLTSDEYLLAPRLIMERYLHFAPKTTLEYLEALSHRLNSKVIDLFSKNSQKIDAFIARILNPTYSYVKDSIAASKWVHSNLLTQGYHLTPVERPEFQSLRVMAQLYHTQGIEKVLEKAEEMWGQWYTHASPTLFNAGTTNPTMSSCFLVGLEDNRDSLMQGAANIAEISANNGGVGVNYNNIRHSAISYSGISKGAIPFMRITDKTVGCLDQGGKRNGAGTLYLRIWHIDVEDFIDCLPKDVDASKAIHNVQGCLWMSDLFFERVSKKEKWTLFCPHTVEKIKELYNDEFEEGYLVMEELARSIRQEKEVLLQEIAVSEDDLLHVDPRGLTSKRQELAMFIKTREIFYREVDAVKLMEHICRVQIRDGPYIMHGDAINRKSQVANIGPINCSNLCTEIAEHSSATEIPSCNLGALNLPKFISGKIDNHLEDREVYMRHELNRSYDYNHLGSKTRSLVENINKVIDENRYPLDRFKDGEVIQGPISQTNFRHRPIGIGVSGLYNSCVGMGFGFDSKLGFLHNRMVFACMYYNALVESMRLAIREGEYSSFRTGKCRLFDETTNTFKTYQGSPLANGFFQFDLWAKEYYYLKHLGRLVEEETYEDGETIEVYQLKNILPLQPQEWNQRDIVISETNLRGEKIEFTMKGTWEGLRHAIRRYGIRNSLLIAPMPTASTANIVSTVEAFEAPTGLIYAKRIKDANDVYAVPEFIREMKSLGLMTRDIYSFIVCSQGSIQDLGIFLKKFYPEKEFDWVAIQRLQDIYKTAYEISQRDTARMCQQRGIYVDQSQSFNVFLGFPTVDVLSAFHLFTYRLGLKTGMYYLRQLPPAPPASFSFDPEIMIFAREQMRRRREAYLGGETYEEMIATCSLKNREECVMCSV